MKMKVHDLIHKNLPPAHILSQINPVQNIPSYFLRTTLILSSYLFLCLPNCLFSTSLPVKTVYAFRFSIICATWNFPTHLLYPPPPS
jgi:hypothetical protein